MTAWRALTAVILLFMAAPILVVLPISLSSGEMLTLPIPGVSFRWYAELVTNPAWLAAARNSLVVGLSTMALATSLGTLAAIGLHFGRPPARPALLALLSLPMVTPVIVAAVAMYFAFAAAGISGTTPGLVLAHTVLALPYVVLTVLATLEGFDADLLAAAASLGAPPAAAARRVLLPILAPGVAAGAIFAFAISFDELVVALFLAGPDQVTLPRQMYAGINEFLRPTICAAAVVLVLVSMLMLLADAALRRTPPGERA